jgi:prophage regulatory protein
MRILSYADLRTQKGIRWSRQHIHNLVKQGKFPKPLDMGPQTVGFVEDEIDAFIASRIRERNEAAAA